MNLSRRAIRRHARLYGPRLTRDALLVAAEQARAADSLDGCLRLLGYARLYAQSPADCARLTRWMHVVALEKIVRGSGPVDGVGGSAVQQNMIG